MNTLQGSCHTGKNILFTKPRNAGHGVTFDMRCVQNIQYEIFMMGVAKRAEAKIAASLNLLRCCSF